MNADPQPQDKSPEEKPKKKLGFKRIVLGVAGVLALLWLASVVLNQYEKPEPARRSDSETAQHQESAAPAAPAETAHPQAAAPAMHDDAAPAAPAHETQAAEPPAEDELTTALAQKLRQTESSPAPAEPAAAHAPAPPAAPSAHTPAPAAPQEHAAPAPQVAPAAAPQVHAPQAHAPPAAPAVTGVAFVGALVSIMNHELNERFYGWRPNDILDFTDNVNNIQLGVLEVARRTAEVLVERISRTGTTQAFDKDLEKARNNLMINADQYWLPSAETSYDEAIEALRRYQHKLEKGTAFFYNRTDNLIPLLQAYENLLGSCDDNLIKMKENDGSDVSWFRADDYFYYAQGVAGAMHAILEAVAVDFANTIEPRRGTDVLHHALTALHHAMEIDPLIVLDGDPSGFLANHRANLAGAISHSRFYIGLLIQALST
jgi:hypothetical protein